jgi:hypothetical protein
MFLSRFPLNVLYFSLASFVIVYFLFQKKLLSKPITKIVSKILFYPTFPITAILRLGNYWTPIDDTVNNIKISHIFLMCGIDYTRMCTNGLP